ncbi:MAG: Omp28 family outer membrane lipoprotein [Prevotellaceae bacterium]|nr:Omp28 family outer membrane lipoprotein [Prevotellaceae bacterium]
MKIGKLSYILYACAAVAAFTSCDSIDEDERYILGDAVVAKRNVLIEDFTGQNCVNCPNAHEVIDALKAGENGESIIAVSIHAGRLAMDAPIIGLKTEEGDKYADKWGIAVYPSGIINRNPTIISENEWSSVVRTELEKDASLDIDLSATLSMDGTSVNINTELKPTKSIEGKLQLWITESNIVTIQQTSSGYNGSYIHNHVFRSSVNGTWGEDVSLSTENVTKQYHIDINKTWKAENLSIVAFVYNDSEGVLQVVETPVVSLVED